MNCPIPHYSTISNIRCYSCMGVVSVFPRPLLPKVFFGRSHKLPKFGVHIHQLVSPDCTVFHSPNGEASHCKWSSWREKRMSWSHGMPGSNPTEGSFLDENSGFWFLFPRRTKKKRPFLGMNKGWSSIFYHILLYIKLRPYLIFWYILVKSSFLLV